MEITIIIGLVLFLVCAFLAIKLIKNVLVSIGTIVLLVLIFIAATGFFIYNDAMALRENFPNSPNQFLLVEGDAVHTGLVILPGDEFSMPDSLRPIPLTKRPDLRGHFKQKEYDAMLADITQSDFELSGYQEETFMIVFVDMNVINDAPMDGFRLSALADDPSLDALGAIDKETIVNLLRSDDAWTYLRDYLVANMNFDIDSYLASVGNQNGSGDILPDEVELTEEQRARLVDETIIPELKTRLITVLGTDRLKPVIFMLYMGAVASEEDGAKYLFLQYKSGNIYVYPNSMIFDLFRLSPASLFDRVVAEGRNAIGEVTTELQNEPDFQE